MCSKIDKGAPKSKHYDSLKYIGDEDLLHGRYILENGETGMVLHEVAQKGLLTSVESLENLRSWHSYDINTTTLGAVRTPLHLAAYNGHFDTCKVLVQKGANVEGQRGLRGC